MVAILLAAAAACGGDPTGPDDPLGPLVPDLEPFYWFQGGKISLRITPDTFSVLAPGTDAAEAASAALPGRELEVTAVDDLSDRHRLLEVSGAGRERAPAISDRMWNHPAITFAAPVYRVAEGERSAGAWYVPLNTVSVQFRRDVDDEAARRLNRRLGTRVEREPELEQGWHVLRLPDDLVDGRDALDIASIYARHDLTEWADLNNITDFSFPGAARRPDDGGTHDRDVRRVPGQDDSPGDTAVGSGRSLVRGRTARSSPQNTEKLTPSR